MIRALLILMLGLFTMAPALAQLSVPAMTMMNSRLTNENVNPTPNVFLAETPLREFDLKTQKLRDTVRMAKRGDVFNIVSTANDGQDMWCVVKFWKFINAAKDNMWLSEADNNKYYAIRMSDFQVRSRPYAKTSSATFGSIMVPIKFRFGNGRDRLFDFSKDVAIGTSFGYRRGLSAFQTHYINYLMNISVSSVTLDPFNTNKAVQVNTDVAAFTPALGLLLELNDVQIGLFTGMDYVAKELGRSWSNQGKPWLSFGIGYRLLTWNSTATSRGTNK